MGVTVTEKELKDTERELMDLIAKRKQLENNLSNIETNIHLLEGTYLEETIHGNVVRGYEGYGSQRTMRKQRPHDGDRIFSQSSLSYLKVTARRV
ncbi:histone acetyltransferase subunit NuA4-domain-containing protein [Gorgonomyces haynaldii]|nr:histone acetyltransferase subunit NuA4-domain-containing protein [Gorgonomyces haynaldii]